MCCVPVAPVQYHIPLHTFVFFTARTKWKRRTARRYRVFQGGRSSQLRSMMQINPRATGGGEISGRQSIRLYRKNGYRAHQLRRPHFKSLVCWVALETRIARSHIRQTPLRTGPDSHVRRDEMRCRRRLLIVLSHITSGGFLEFTRRALVPYEL